MREEPSSRQEALPDFGDDSPSLYLGMPLSHLSNEKDRRLVEFAAYTIDRAIMDAEGSEEECRIRIHSPIKLTAPWKEDGWSEEQIYLINSDKLWRDCDAMILIADGGGSLGLGQELEWACDLQLPVLYVHPHGEPVSRQILGAAQHRDIEICDFKDPADLEDKVGRWLASRKLEIFDGPRRRRNRHLLFRERARQMREVWNSLDSAERGRACVAARLTVKRLVRLLRDPMALAAASAQEVLALESALGLPPADASTAPLPDLKPDQLEALLAAAQENAWDGKTTSLLHEKAREELAREGIRRFPLSDIRSWVELHRRWFGRDH